MRLSINEVSHFGLSPSSGYYIIDNNKMNKTLPNNSINEGISNNYNSSIQILTVI